MNNPFSRKPSLTDAPLSAAERRVGLPAQDFRERVIFAVARNLIPVIGVLFLGWSPVDLMVLYFADTLGGMWALIMALATQFDAGLGQRPLLARVWGLFGLFLVSAFLVGFIAIPLGMPLFFLTMATDWNLAEALADPSFVWALALIAALALIGMFRHVVMLRTESKGEERMRDEFGILFVRWFIVIAMIYLFGIFFGEWGAFLIVIGYGVVTVISELYPRRFLGWFDSKRKG